MKFNHYECAYLTNLRKFENWTLLNHYILKQYASLVTFICKSSYICLLFVLFSPFGCYVSLWMKFQQFWVCLVDKFAEIWKLNALELSYSETLFLCLYNFYENDFQRQLNFSCIQFNSKNNKSANILPQGGYVKSRRAWELAVDQMMFMFRSCRIVSKNAASWMIEVICPKKFNLCAFTAAGVFFYLLRILIFY